MIIGIHNNNEWESPDYEYTGDIPTDMQVAEAEISDLKQRIKSLKDIVEKMQEIERGLPLNLPLFNHEKENIDTIGKYISLKETLFYKIKNV